MKDFLIDKIKRPHIILFLTGIICSSINFIMPMFLTRILNMNQYGLYKAFFTYASFMPFLSLGGGPVNSLYYWLNKNDDSTSQVQSNYMLILLQAISIITILLLSLSLIKINNDIINQYLPIYLLFIFIASGSAYYPEALVAKGEVLKGSLVYTLFELIKVSGIIAYAYYTKKTDEIIWYYTLISVLAFIFSLFFGLRKKFIGVAFKKAHLKETFQYSLPLSLQSLMYFAIEKLDLLFLSFFLSHELFGIYATGCLAIPPIIIWENSIQKKIIPELTQSFANKNYLEAKKNILWSIGQLSKFIIPFIIFIEVFAEKIITTLFTSSYSGSVSILQVFTLSYLTHIFPSDAIQRASGKTHNLIYINALFLLMYLTTLFITKDNISLHQVIAISVVYKVSLRLIIFLFGLKILSKLKR